jgi:hypothetical protein
MVLSSSSDVVKNEGEEAKIRFSSPYVKVERFRFSSKRITAVFSTDLGIVSVRLLYVRVFTNVDALG